MNKPKVPKGSGCFRFNHTSHSEPKRKPSEAAVPEKLCWVTGASRTRLKTPNEMITLGGRGGCVQPWHASQALPRLHSLTPPAPFRHHLNGAVTQDWKLEEPFFHTNHLKVLFHIVQSVHFDHCEPTNSISCHFFTQKNHTFLTDWGTTGRMWQICPNYIFISSAMAVKGTSCTRMISFHGRICAPIDSCQYKQGHLCTAASPRTNDRLQNPIRKFHSWWKYWSINSLVYMKSAVVSWDMEGFRGVYYFQTPPMEQQWRGTWEWRQLAHEDNKRKPNVSVASEWANKLKKLN